MGSVLCSLIAPFGREAKPGFEVIADVAQRACRVFETACRFQMGRNLVEEQVALRFASLSNQMVSESYEVLKGYKLPFMTYFRPKGYASDRKFVWDVEVMANCICRCYVA